MGIKNRNKCRQTEYAQVIVFKIQFVLLICKKI